MGMEHPELSDILKDVRAASENISAYNSETNERISAVENSVNELYRKANRPGSGGVRDDIERKDAIDYCVLKHEIDVPKNDGLTPAYTPSHSEIENALTAKAAMKSLFRKGNHEHLSVEHKKSLTAFSFGSNSFVLSPQQSNRVISCIYDPTDVAGMMGQASTSSGSLKFFVDNQRMSVAGWACEASCFANNPQPDLSEGLGELEIKPETLRFVVCAGSDLLADASFNVEQWILQKASQGFRNTINDAVVVGDGIGKPLGFMHPNAGIPVCETSASTPAGEFSWQDLVQLKFELPMQLHEGASYLMNQKTFALLLTLSDAATRPLFGQLPSGLPGYMFAGSPITIVSQMPDVAAGTTPILFGNLRETYIVVTRQGVTMQPDHYSAGWCVLYKFSARVGGGVLCPNASRLLRIR